MGRGGGEDGGENRLDAVVTEEEAAVVWYNNNNLKRTFIDFAQWKIGIAKEGPTIQGLIAHSNATRTIKKQAISIEAVIEGTQGGRCSQPLVACQY